MTKRERTVLPHSPDAEQGILGGVLLRNEMMRALAELEPQDFYDPRHRAIWTAMQEIDAAKRPIDAVTLEEALERAGRFDAVGGMVYLGELTYRVPTPENVVEYAAIVRKKAATRRIVLAMSELMDRVKTDGLEGDDLASEVGEIVAQHQRGSPTGGQVIGEMVKQVVRTAIELAERRAAGETVRVGLPTGLPYLDESVGGVPYGSPTWVCGRPAGGKSLIMQGWAEHMADVMGPEVVVLYLSNEDPAVSMATRRLAATSDVPTAAIRGGHVGSTEVMRRLMAGAERARRIRVVFVKIHGKHGGEVAKLIRRFQYDASGRRVVCAFVDYVQNMAAPPRISDRVAAIGYNVQALGDCAGDLNCGLVGGVQLNRAIDSRPWTQGGPVPTLADLKGAGDLEQAGKVIVAAYHPWHHSKAMADGTREDPRTKSPVSKDLLELLLLKNFEGEGGGASIPLRWDAPYHRVVPWPQGDLPALTAGHGAAAGPDWNDIPLPTEYR